MKAIYLSKYGGADKAFTIKDLITPTIDDDEVLIKNACFGLNFADVVARRGLYPDAPKNPAILGYDVAGTVVEIGKNVTHVKQGDRVVALTRFGGYAEYSKTMKEGVAFLPDKTSFEEGTALATQACTAYYAAVQCINLNEGDQVLIQAAAGGVGTILTQIAKHKGCTVFGTASTKKQQVLRDNKVDFPIDYTSENFSKVIKETLDGNKLDVVFDSIGGKAFKQGWKLLQPGGTMVNFGAAAQISGSNKLKSLGVVLGFGLFTPLQLLMSSKSMVGVNMLRIADFKPHLLKQAFEGVMSYVDQGIIQPKISKVYAAEEIATAHNYLESRQSIGKIVMKW